MDLKKISNYITDEGVDGDQAGQDADEEDGGTEDEDEDDILPSDVIPPKPTGDRRLSIQMGAVMVSFDVDCHENDDVDEKDLLCKRIQILNLFRL